MCGLIGVVCKKSNGFSNKHQEIFSSLMFVDTLRGKDSTGLFVISNEGEVYGAKEAQMAPYFMLSKEYDEAQKRAWRNGAAMIGHNRAATKGKIVDENAHPFVVDNNIVLVHNGTMRSDHKQHADVEVDSHAIAHLIHEKESLGEALGAFYGAYALMWFDVKKQELNMIRNDERPLFWMEVEDAWIWSSEVSMLEFATRRCDIKIISEPTSLPPDTLQKFTLVNRSWKATSEKVEIKKPVYTQTGSVNEGGGGRDSAFYDQVWGEGVDSLNDDGPPFRRGYSMAEWDQQLENRRAQSAADAAWESLTSKGSRFQGDGPATRPVRHPQHKVVQLLPKSPTPDNAGGMVSEREPVAAAQAGNITEREKILLSKLNKGVSHGHWQYVLDTYKYNQLVHCQAFDYLSVNGKDGSDGWFLYASPFDDSDVVFRHWFPAKSVTEERMIQLAGCDYIFEFALGQREWFPKEWPTDGVIHDDTPGYTIIRSTGAKLISTGISQIAH